MKARNIHGEGLLLFAMLYGSVKYMYSSKGVLIICIQCIINQSQIHIIGT